MAGDLGASAGRADDADQVEGGKLGVQIRPSHAQLLQGRGSEGGEQYIGVGQQLVQLGLSFGGFQVSLDNFHTGMQLGIGLGRVQAHGVGR